jgi:EpsD family peptidyl-prolyl cis-trans isomerase
LCTLAALGTACNRHEPPQGQVIALVNGTEITVAELNEEARARGIPIGRDPALKAALIAELVDRKLLVQRAQEQGLDREPGYLLAKRRSDEILLAQQILAAATDSGRVADGELKRYIAANPAAFGRRALVSVDQLAITGQVPAELQRAVAGAPTIERMQQLVAAAGLSASRASETVDSGSPLDLRGPLLVGLSAGQNFVLPRPGGLIAGKVVTVVPQPVAADQQLQVARERLKQQRTQAALERLLQQLRPGARVQYQPDFAPAAAGGGR